VAAPLTLRPVPLRAVEVRPGFWSGRMDANHHGVRVLYERLVEHGVVSNFQPGADRRGLWFTDSDLYKWMEAACYCLVRTPDPELSSKLDEAVSAVVGAQDENGYLNTNFGPGNRFRDLGWSHELYCAGHLIQAGLALEAVLGQSDLLSAARRFSDLIVATFADGAREERDRHPVIEMALVDLSRHTHDDHYRALARSLCDRVGAQAWQRLWGHAVCALYFACGLTDLALDGDTARAPLVSRLWDDLVTTSSYVTGGVGGRWVGESIGRPYELPNEGAYAESCSAVGAAQWAWRMLQLTGEAPVADQLERIVHNALLASVSLEGDSWFYANPLGSSAAHEHHPFIEDVLTEQIAGPLPLSRLPWRDVTCCPPNVGRLLASVPAYCYLARPGELRVVGYLPSRVRTGAFDVTVETAMPWAGDVRITVHRAPTGPAALTVRIPEWSAEVDAGSWRTYRREWRADDVVELDLGVETRLVRCDPHVPENRGCAAVQRGPFVYCAEQADQPSVDLAAIRLENLGTHQWRPELLGGIVTVGAAGRPATRGSRLYGFVPLQRSTALGGQPVPAGGRAEVPLTLIPYFAWANRTPGPMVTWIPLGSAAR